MRTLFMVLAAILAVGALGCAPSISVKHDYDKEANFAALKTFDWLPQPTAAAGSVQAALQRNSLLDQRIKNAVNGQLAAKAYTQNANNPDFVLMYHTGAEDKVNVTDWGYGYGRYGRYGSGGIDVYQYKEGTLILDIVEAKSKQLVWRGFATGTIDPDAPMEKREKKINDAIMMILAKFPPTAK